MTDNKSQKRIFITGVNSGIGNELLKLSLAKNWQVTGVVRSIDQHQNFKKDYPAVTTLVADLSSPEDVSKLCGEVKTQEYDYIVFNAAMANVGVFDKLSDKSIRETMETNLVTNMRLTRAMIAKAISTKAKIVYISSLAAQYASSKFSSYSASKAGLSHFVRCIRKEYPSVPMLCVEIGGVNTPFHQKANSQINNLEKFKTPQWIAEKLIKAVENKTGVATLSWDWWIFRRILVLLNL